MKKQSDILMRYAAERCGEIYYNEETVNKEAEFEKMLPEKLKEVYVSLSEEMAYEQQKRETEIYIRGMKDCYGIIKILEN